MCVSLLVHQWMTAGRGVVHAEMPVSDEAVVGLQLWVNLSRRDKMVEPAYQELKDSDIPKPSQGGVTVTVISGEALGAKVCVCCCVWEHVYLWGVATTTTTLNQVAIRRALNTLFSFLEEDLMVIFSFAECLSNQDNQTNNDMGVCVCICVWGYGRLPQLTSISVKKKQHPARNDLLAQLCVCVSFYFTCEKPSV